MTVRGPSSVEGWGNLQRERPAMRYPAICGTQETETPRHVLGEPGGTPETLRPLRGAISKRENGGELGVKCGKHQSLCRRELDARHHHASTGTANRL